MAETKDPEEPTLASKRKPDPSCEDNEGHPNKTQKLQNPNNNSQLSEDKTQNSDEKDVDLDAQEDNNNDAAAAAEDDDDESDDDDDADSNGEATEVDRKGKGILIEEGDDDDDDSSDGGSQSDGDSDLSDDPLAEVDLDNILPSRTRRKVIQPGDYIANDVGGPDDDDSDSDA
ncbi:hypothetical protein Ddye_004617 [Dipteronia dyeriana]|uniref:Histone chaperone domain-containing protein n=1 Tax=Dipteronia dyeriana TaxID=168575 RepID=A0AAE0CXS6_9ROSI|nr:hypothetical protein Ddye_004617 [Dipteronia dyeriana]